MKNIGVLAVVIGFGAIATVACGGDDNNGAPKSGGTAGAPGSTAGKGGSGGSGGSTDEKAGSAGMAGQAPVGGTTTQGGAPEGGAGGEGGAPMQPPTFVSLPNAELSLDAETQAAGYTLRSSHLTEHPSGSSYYKEWFAEVYNGTGATQCFIQVDADFQDATGSSLLKLHTYAYGPAYDMGDGLKLTGTCAAAGDTLPLWSNALDSTNVDLNGIKKIVVHVEALETPKAKLHPSTPTLGPVTQAKDPQLDWWTFKGNATAVADIYNVKLEFWGKSGGFVVGNADAFHADNFFKGDSWSYETLAGIDVPTLDGPATPYFEFIDGLDSALRVVYSGEQAVQAEQRSAANAEHRANDERRKQAH